MISKYFSPPVFGDAASFGVMKDQEGHISLTQSEHQWEAERERRRGCREGRRTEEAARRISVSLVPLIAQSSTHSACRDTCIHMTAGVSAVGTKFRLPTRLALLARGSRELGCRNEEWEGGKMVFHISPPQPPPSSPPRRGARFCGGCACVSLRR